MRNPGRQQWACLWNQPTWQMDFQLGVKANLVSFPCICDQNTQGFFFFFCLKMTYSVEMQFQKIIKGQPYKLLLLLPKMLTPESSTDNPPERWASTQEVIPSLPLSLNAALTSTRKQKLQVFYHNFQEKKKEVWLDRGRQTVREWGTKLGGMPGLAIISFFRLIKAQSCLALAAHGKFFAFTARQRVWSPGLQGGHQPCHSSMTCLWIPIQRQPAWNGMFIQSLSKSLKLNWRGPGNF